MSSDVRQIDLDIQGMTCGGCVGHVESRLAAVEGVTSATVHYPAGTAAVMVRPTVGRRRSSRLWRGRRTPLMPSGCRIQRCRG